MFNNLVNRHDADRLLRKVRRLELNPVVAKLRVRGGARVVEHWTEVEPSLTQWWAIPSVIRRWNRLMTGDPDLSFPRYVARAHFPRRAACAACRSAAAPAGTNCCGRAPGPSRC
ncbi:hypothetical protein VSR01_37275 [Actinacidiphila sp. DG2A-62]|uniref:hypothetical protein n=1 Tax=Actinacidiphila sp. DG2A-62 TaxID=3108821 RepID=UPI002DB63EFB|nr:hypothetical protein [Actinacidiphila sp. DG2A-62]MEC3998835.1 hypothetical protein [Actinacidiphila sp. DG2A-62]